MKKKTHYYTDKPKDGWTTACGRDGRKTGGLIDYFFCKTKTTDRCHTCNKRYQKDVGL